MNSPPANSSASRNIRLRLAYDGTRYAGWQVQPGRETIQGVLEAAILKVSGESVRVLSAGRTDAGVHALGQVASFRSCSPVPPEKWRPALQSFLPEDVVILQSDEAPPAFHATFSAISKRYRYVILNQAVPHPFLGRFSWRIGQPLSAQAMHAAAQSLVGTHDFRSFESDWPNKATSVRTVKEISIRRLPALSLFDTALPPLAGDSIEAPLISLEIEADGFLYNMVRAITGTLVNVGRGSWTQDRVAAALAACDRSVAGATAPACGLFMVRVNYLPDDQHGATPPTLEDVGRQT